MQPIETFEHAGLKISIYQDEDAESPREFDNIGTMVCFHKRYQLGDKDHGFREDDYHSWDEVKAAIEAKHGPLAAILPLGLLDHSGISMYIGSGPNPFDPGGWDSGQVGFIFVSRERALKEFGGKYLTRATKQRAEKCLRAEVEAYDQYLRGDVYGYVIERPSNCEACGSAEADPVDSLWGMYGFDYCKSEAMAAAASQKENKEHVQ